jgi:hypothetical protein
MGLDIRWPIGFMFSLIGILLVITSFINKPETRPLGINVNLYWGLLLVAFGVLMLVFARRGKEKAASQQPDEKK